MSSQLNQFVTENLHFRKAVKKEDWALAIKEGVSGWNIAMTMFGHQSPQVFIVK